MKNKKSRVKCANGTYHIVIRGVNRQIIFECADDYRRFLHALKKYAENAGAKIYAWCLMDNHVHILLKEGMEKLSITMQRMEVSYVNYFNKKNERVGPLFQGRFFSRPIEGENDFLRVYNYIALNPVKAGLAHTPEAYMWSWLGFGGTEEKFVSDAGYNVCLSCNDFTKEEMADLEMETHKRVDAWIISDEEALRKMAELTGCKNSRDIQQLGIKERDLAIKKLLAIKLSPMQISRITGVNRTIVYRIKKRIP